MYQMDSKASIEKDQIIRVIIDILKYLTSDWDMDFSEEITAETHIVADLYFESLDVVQLVIAIEQRFGRKNLPFEKLLMFEGRYVDDLSVNEIADFLSQNL